MDYEIVQEIHEAIQEVLELNGLPPCSFILVLWGTTESLILHSCEKAKITDVLCTVINQLETKQ